MRKKCKEPSEDNSGAGVLSPQCKRGKLGVCTSVRWTVGWCALDMKESCWEILAFFLCVCVYVCAMLRNLILWPIYRLVEASRNENTTRL